MMAIRDRGPDGVVLALGGAANLAVAALFAVHVRQPHLRYDDFWFLTGSRTWPEALGLLWQPINDHAMPLCRIAAALLWQVVPGQSAIPTAAELQGPLAVILGMWLLYLFVRRELGEPVLGLIAMAAFGVTSAYIQAVTWYSASFFILSLDTLLLALLAAQRWRHGRRLSSLCLCGAWCALAPGWFGGGVLAGAWCALYLLPVYADDRLGSPHVAVPAWRERARRYGPAAAPLAGTLLFLAASLPQTFDRIVHASHYGGRTVFQAFSMSAAVTDTIRTLADNQVIGAFGIYRPSALGWPSVLAIAGGLLGLSVVWWRRAPTHRLLVLGVSIVLASDFLTYGSRAGWGYERTVHTWTRYHLFPHLGLVLFIVGGLPAFLGRPNPAAERVGLTTRRAAAVLVMIAIAFVLHLPRSLRTHVYFPQQMALMKRVERVDRYCRTVGISGRTARAALGFLAFPVGYAGDNAWEFLRGSPEPGTVTVEQARRLLAQ